MRYVTLCALLALSACAPADVQNAVDKGASIISNLNTDAGIVSAGVANACIDTASDRALIGLLLPGATAAVDAGCADAQNMAILTANDTAPVTATNSGDSGSWVLNTTAQLKAQALQKQHALIKSGT